MAKHPHKPPLVEVFWTDACDIRDSFTLEDAAKQELMERHNVGYLIVTNEKKTIIAHGFDPPEEVEHVLIIPTGWIQKIRYVRKPRVKKENVDAQVEETKEPPTSSGS